MATRCRQACRQASSVVPSQILRPSSCFSSGFDTSGTPVCVWRHPAGACPVIGRRCWLKLSRRRWTSMCASTLICNATSLHVFQPTFESGGGSPLPSTLREYAARLRGARPCRMARGIQTRVWRARGRERRRVAVVSPASLRALTQTSPSPLLLLLQALKSPPRSQVGQVLRCRGLPTLNGQAPAGACAATAGIPGPASIH